MTFLLFSAALACYLLAAAAHIVRFFRGRPGLDQAARRLFLAAFGLHSVTILARWFEAGYTPITTPHETVSFFAWGRGACYLSLRLRAEVKNLGPFVCLLAFLVMLTAAFVSRAPATEIPDSLRSLWLPAHASLSLLAYDCFALAAVGGLMYLLQERNIKRKRFGILYSRLPDLETLDRLGLHCLSVGFPLLTLGMITGSLWAWRAFGSYWRWNATEVWTLAVWLIYAALFHQRLTVGWRGRRAAWLAIGALALALFAFWGVTAFFSGYHGNFS